MSEPVKFRDVVKALQTLQRAVADRYARKTQKRVVVIGQKGFMVIDEATLDHYDWTEVNVAKELLNL